MFDRIKRFVRSISQLPDKKKYIEFITAILSIPVLLSVILLNYTNLQNQNNSNDNTPQPSPAVITIIRDRDDNNSDSNSDSEPTVSNTECTPEVGPVTIVSPEAGETINDNPLTIVVSQNDDDNEYCAIVWSYRINNDTWSNFDDRDIAIYNLESGEKKLDVRFKSIISGDEETITRTFYYQNTQQVSTPTTAPTSTTQPTITPSPSPTTQIQQTES